MKELSRIPELHPSQRGWFAEALRQEMEENPRIVLVTGDLGYKMLDKIRDQFPERVVNVGAAEQTMLGVAVGLAMHRAIPVVYSITNFLLYRGFETIRNYIDHEQIPVKLIGGGRDKDYAHDGYSHWSEDAKKIMDAAFPNIVQVWPETKEQIPDMLKEVLTNGKPTFVSLRR